MQKALGKGIRLSGLIQKRTLYPQDSNHSNISSIMWRQITLFPSPVSNLPLAAGVISYREVPQDLWSKGAAGSLL